MLAAGLFQQFAGFLFRVFRVVGLYDDVKLVVRHLRKTEIFQQWMMQALQAVQEQHPPQRAEGTQQDGHLVGDREG